MPDFIDYRTADMTTLLSDNRVQCLLDLFDEYPHWTVHEYVDYLKQTGTQDTLTQEQVKLIIRRLQLHTTIQRNIRKLWTDDWWEDPERQEYIKKTYPEVIPYITIRRAYLEKRGVIPGEFDVDVERVNLATLLSDRSVQQLLTLAEEHPDWDVEVLHNKLILISGGKQKLSYSQVLAILKRLRMVTPNQRILRLSKLDEWGGMGIHSKLSLRKSFPDLYWYIKYRKQYHRESAAQAVDKPRVPLKTLPSVPTPQIKPQFNFTPAQEEIIQHYDRFFFLTRQFSLVIFGAFLYLILGSAVLDVLFQVEGILQKIGMFFSFTAFTFGLLFLIYSFKYYLTIAVILSFSRNKHETKAKGSFLSRLFGFSIETEPKSNSLTQAAQESPDSLGSVPALSVTDLSQITLDHHPFISIHVATYNEKRVIDRFLLAVTSMEYDNYEIIVADDSSDETVQLLEQWKTHPRVKISHRTTREGYKGGALKEALKVMDQRAEFVLIFDADFIPYPDTIIQFLKYFKAATGTLDFQPEFATSSNRLSAGDSNIAAVQGYQWHVLNKSENWITRGVRTEYAGSYVIERSGEEVYGGIKQLSGSVYMIRADVLKAIGWGTSITEDFELTLKLYVTGYKVVYTPYIQTPAEAAATLKRLIRQRMRWAEGHSFNVRRMFNSLLFGHWEDRLSIVNPHLASDRKIWVKSPLSRAEKLEFLYLAPYYLQAFFFIVGTLSWFTAEMIFRVRLPFWTETWGWSLVLTNLFALPLMNMVGLFMEESEEKDYFGLISFIFLSYIVAPFQAFAAVKGFLENEEGPWFRTPKTGRITDSFAPGRFYRFVKGMFGVETGTVAQSKLGSLLFPQNIKGEEDKAFFHKYLALATANNTFERFRIPQKRVRGIVNLTVVVLLLSSMALSLVSIPLENSKAFTGTFYFHKNQADNLASITALQQREMTTVSPSTSTEAENLNSVSTSEYFLTDNMNKMWTTGDLKVANNTTGDKRMVDIAQDSSGNSVMVWADSRNSAGVNDKFTATTGGLVQGREVGNSTLLQNGKVLIAGGYTTSYASTAELYDPAASTFSLLSNTMNIPRGYASQTLLMNGKVLIAGGSNGSVSHSTAELYDPNTSTFSLTANNLPYKFLGHTATLLNSGKVLIAGGGVGTSKAAEVYDPLTNTFTNTQNLMLGDTEYHTATLLPNGKVLIAGGDNGSVLYTNAEIFDPVTEGFSYSANSILNGGRTGHTATLLNSGKVLIVGGCTTAGSSYCAGGATYFSEAELYDPATNTFSQTKGSMVTARGNHSATLLNSGKVLITGGQLSGNALSSAELYDPSADTFTLTRTMMVSASNLAQNQVVLLHNGQVLLPGGENPSVISAAELFIPSTYDVYAQKYNKDGTEQWTTGGIKVNSDDGNRGTTAPSPSNYDHLNPRIAMDGSGNSYITWQEAKNSVYGDDIYAQKLDTSGSKLWPDTSGNVNKFTAAGNMTDRRDGPAVALLNNGKILVVAGGSFRSTAEMYDPSANTFAATGNMVGGFGGSTILASVLNNGKVLVAGGGGGSSEGEIFDPAAGTFTMAANYMTVGRFAFTQTLLPNGKVLLVGGSSGANYWSSAELYDPSTNKFSLLSSGSNAQRTYHTATLLQNGKVLITGGCNNSCNTKISNAEIFDPQTNTFSSTVGGLKTARTMHSAVLLNNGKVLIAGGGGASWLSTAELFDPAAGTFTLTAGGMTDYRAIHESTLLPNGKVLITGGTDTNYLSTAELYDPVNNNFSLTSNNMSAVRIYHMSTLMPNGKVLILGGEDVGSNAQSSAELYTPTSDIEVSNDGSPTNATGLPRPEHPDNGKGILGEQRNPAIAVDGSGNADIAWEDTRFQALQNWGLSYNYDSNAWWQTNTNFGASGQCSGGAGSRGSCGAMPVMLSSPVRIMGQKLNLNGIKQWGNSQNAINLNNPQDLILSATGDENHDPSLAFDSVNNAIMAWDSGGANGSGSQWKEKNIYTQKFDANGNALWGGSFSATGSLQTARLQAITLLLPNGKVLIANGNDTNDYSTAEIY